MRDDEERSIRRAFSTDVAPRVDVDRAWQAVCERLDATSSGRRRTRAGGIVAVVASVVAMTAIVVSASVFARRTEPKRPNTPAPVTTPPVTTPPTTAATTTTGLAETPALALRNWTYRGPVHVGAAGDIDSAAAGAWAAAHSQQSAGDVGLLPLLGIALPTGSKVLIFQGWVSTSSDVYLAAYRQPTNSAGSVLSDVLMSRTPGQISGVIHDGGSAYVVALGPVGSDVRYADRDRDYVNDRSAGTDAGSYGVFARDTTSPPGTLLVTRDKSDPPDECACMQNVAVYNGPVGSLFAVRGSTVTDGLLSIELPPGWYGPERVIGPGDPRPLVPVISVANFPIDLGSLIELPGNIDDPILAMAGTDGILIGVAVTDRRPTTPATAPFQLLDTDWLDPTSPGTPVGHSVAERVFSVPSAHLNVLVHVEIGRDPPNAGALATANSVLRGLKVG